MFGLHSKGAACWIELVVDPGVSVFSLSFFLSSPELLGHGRGMCDVL